MKKNWIIGTALLLFVVIFAVSCTKEETQAAEEPAAVVVLETEQIMHPGLVIEDRVSKWSENAEGVMIHKEYSDIGEAVQVFMIKDPDNPNNVIPEMKKAIRNTDKSERDFYHVITDDGQDLWIQTYYVAADVIPGIIMDANAFLFSGPKIADIYTDSRKLPQYEFVGVHQADSTSDFLCVSCYVLEWLNQNIYTVVSKQFVRRDAVTTNTLDMDVLELLQVAESLKDETAKREVLSEAMSKGGNFNYLVVEALNKLNGTASVSSFTVTPYQAGGDFVTADEENGNINVRNNPGTEGTEVLFAVPVNTAIIVTGLTNETEIIADYEDYWYQVSVPSMGNRTGWIFGRYISRK